MWLEESEEQGEQLEARSQALGWAGASRAARSRPL